MGMSVHLSDVYQHYLPMVDHKAMGAVGTLYFPSDPMPFDLSLTENPLGATKRLEAFQIDREELSAYPRQSSEHVKSMLATHLKVASGQILIRAGIDDLLHGLAGSLTRPGDEILTPQHTFPKMGYYALQRGGRCKTANMSGDLHVDFDRLRACVTKETRLIYLCNPNNPTGLIEDVGDILKLASEVSCLIIVDEANIEYCDASCISRLNEVDNLLILRTFSKAYGLAAARIGYCIGPTWLIEYLEATQPRFAVSTASMLMAEIALADVNHIAETRLHVQRENAFLQSELCSRGFLVYPSDTNCFVACVPKRIPSANWLRDSLHKVGSSFVLGQNFLLPDGFLRLAPRLRNINECFLMSIDTVFAERIKEQPL